jgi:hypothetical protein
MADLRFDPNRRYFPGQGCAGASKMSPDRIGIRESGLRYDGTMVESHSQSGFNCAGNLRANPGPHVAGTQLPPPQS